MDTAQLIGWAAALAGFASLVLRDERRVRIGLIVHTVLYLAHFALLGLPIAVASNVIALLRLTLSLRFHSWWFVACLAVASVVPGVLYFDGWVSILPMLASVVLTYGLFRCQGLALRRILFLGSFLWLVHNIAVESWGGMAVELGMCASSLIGILRSRNVEK